MTRAKNYRSFSASFSSPETEVTDAVSVVGDQTEGPPTHPESKAGGLSELVPSLSVACLSELTFYEIGLDVAEAATVSIAQLVSTNNTYFSTTLLKQVSTVIILDRLS